MLLSSKTWIYVHNRSLVERHQLCLIFGKTIENARCASNPLVFISDSFNGFC